MDAEILDDEFDTENLAGITGKHKGKRKPKRLNGNIFIR